MFSIHDHVRGKTLMTALNLTAGLSICFFGYDQGLMAEVNNSDDYIYTMGLGYIKEGDVPVITNSVKQGGIVSIYYLGTLIGCLVGGIIGDCFWRTRCILVGAAWGIIGAVLKATAQNTPWVLCARVINGIGTGHLNGIVPVWAAEVSEHKTRGAFLAVEFMLNIFGVVVAYWLEYGLEFIKAGKLLYGDDFLSVSKLVCWLFLQFCPGWLVKAGREEEAKYILACLRAHGDASDPIVTAEFDDIVNAVEIERNNATSTSYYHMLFGIRQGNLHTARSVQLVLWLMIIEVWNGIAAITIWAPTIYATAGYSTSKSQLLSGVNNITYMLSVFVAIFTLDKIGRRWTLYYGAVLQGIALFLAGGFSQLTLDNPHKATQYGGTVTFFVFLYTATFGATWLTVPWIYPTEIFPLEMRARGQSWGVAGWSIGFGWTTLVVPIVFSKIGGAKTLYVFGVVNVVSIPIVWAFYPETSQRTLEEMNLLFASKSVFVWNVEKEFQRLREEMIQLYHLGLVKRESIHLSANPEHAKATAMEA